MARKHILIPMHIWELSDLSVTERLIGSLVFGYTEHHKPCFMTNTGFSELLGVSKRTCSAAINRLIDSGHLEELGSGQKRQLGWKLASRGGGSQLLGGVEENDTGGGSQLLPVIHSNTDLNTKHNRMNEEMRRAEKQPMHWQQVRDYFLHLMEKEGANHRTHAEGWAKDFHTYYESRNWRTNHGAISAWRPVAAAWYRRSAKNVPQRAVKQFDGEQLRRDYKYHEKRYNLYTRQDKEELACREIEKMRHIERQLNQAEA